MAEPIQAEDAPQIPDRLFFRIGDVADLTGVEAYVLRYWETEFSALKPKKGSNGQRQYRRKDVQTVLEIKRLLWDEGYTIAGARKALREKSRKKRREPKAPKPKGQVSMFGEPPPFSRTSKISASVLATKAMAAAAVGRASGLPSN